MRSVPWGFLVLAVAVAVVIVTLVIFGERLAVGIGGVVLGLFGLSRIARERRIEREAREAVDRLPDNQSVVDDVNASLGLPGGHK